MSDYSSIEGLRKENRQIKERIARMGFEPSNTEAAHLTHLVDFMVGLNLITEEQALEFCHSWEMELNDQLVTLEMKARDAKADLRRKSRLIVPGL